VRGPKGGTPAPWQTRFWAKVDKDGPPHPTKPELGNCWLWTGAVHESGYGHFNIAGHRPGKIVRVHRLSLELANGPPPEDGLDACHSCDRRLCLRPEHLAWDTRSVNIRDMYRRGRRPMTPGKALLLYGVQGALL
jgi:hypothetical protein